MLNHPGAAAATHSLLRIVAGFLFTFHGAQKLLGWFGGMGPEGGTAPLVSQMGLAGVLELVGGILILIGLFTRPVGFVLAGEMAFAYFIAHFPNGVWPIENQGELAVLFCFTFLYFAFNGAGRWSVDAVRGRHDSESVPAQPRHGARHGRAA